MDTNDAGNINTPSGGPQDGADHLHQATVPCPQHDLSETIHHAAAAAGQSKLFLDLAQRSARNVRVRRILGTLIAAQQAAVESLERLKSGGAGAL